MGIKLGNLAASGFAVSRSGGTCSLRGCLLGSVNFDRYKDLFRNADVVDFRDLGFAGWSGVEALLGFLRGTCFGGRLEAVPTPVFEMIVLQARDGDPFRVGTAGLVGASLEAPDPVVVPVEIAAWRDRVLAEGAQAADELSPGYRYVGGLETLALPASAGAFEGDARRAPAKSGEAFWFLYASYLHLIVTLTINHVETVAAGCLHSANEILVRLEKADDALDALGLRGRVELPRRVDLTGPLLEGFESAIAALEPIEGETRRLVLKLQAIARDPAAKRADPVSLARLLGRLVDLMDAFCRCADEVGVATFNRLMPLSCGDSLKGVLDAVDPSTLPPEILARVSEGFFVLDPFATESWESLRPELDVEISLMDTLVMNLVVDVQGFDSAKQVVEQRARELRHWKKALEESGSEPDPEEMVAVVTSKLVTVHERTAFDLVLGHVKRLAPERVSGLEVNFFDP